MVDSPFDALNTPRSGASAGRNAVANPREQRASPRPRHDRNRPISEMPEYDENIGNTLHIRRDEWPDGIVLQWITASVYGQPQPDNVSKYARRGWEPVHNDEQVQRCWRWPHRARWHDAGSSSEVVG